MMKILGILIGGASSRMGSDKWALRLGELSFLERIVDVGVMGWDPASIIVSVGRDGPSVEMKDEMNSAWSGNVTWVADRERHQGPVHGLGRIAKVLSEEDELVIVPVDVPLLKPEVVEALGVALTGQDSVVVRLGSQWHPLHAAFKGGRWRRELRTYRGSMRGFHEKLHSHQLNREAIARVDKRYLSFMNVNRPEDLETLQAHL